MHKKKRRERDEEVHNNKKHLLIINNKYKIDFIFLFVMSGRLTRAYTFSLFIGTLMIHSTPRQTAACIAFIELTQFLFSKNVADALIPEDEKINHVMDLEDIIASIVRLCLQHSHFSESVILFNMHVSLHCDMRSVASGICMSDMSVNIFMAVIKIKSR